MITMANNDDFKADALIVEEAPDKTQVRLVWDQDNGEHRVVVLEGGSVHNEPIGWKLLRLDEAQSVALLNESAQMPRIGYKRGDKAMARIGC
jgi:hypothetical protein